MSTWPPATVRSRKRDLLDLTEVLQNLDLKSGVLVVAVSRYTVVRAAGYVEAIRDDVADLFVSRVAIDLVSNHVRSGLRGGQGVRPAQLIDFIRSFHTEWASELTDFLDDDSGLRNRRSDLGALVNARKKIAHGDGDSVGRAEALRWATTAEEVGGWLIKRFDPTRNYYERVSASP